MPTRIEVLPVSDFRGGLNLNADAFQLGGSQSPHMLNVNPDHRGGFTLRGAIEPINTTSLPYSPHSLASYFKSDGTSQILAGVLTKTWYSTGENFTPMTKVWTVSDHQEMITFNDTAYIQNGTDAPISWSGSSVGTLTQTFNDDITAPDGGDMPIAKHMAVWQGYVWVANTVESATSYKSRLRFSHPNRAEDWQTLDYIDVDTGHDGDEITALQPLGDMLLVFKRRSVHMIRGFDADSFGVYPLTQGVGAIPGAVAASESSVFWFNWPDGLFEYDGHQITWRYDSLKPSIVDGSVPDTYQNKIKVGFLNRKVWVSVPWESSTDNARTFVYDPSLGKGGGWTAYDVGLGSMLEWAPPSAARQYLAASIGEHPARVMRVEQDANSDTWYTDYLILTGQASTYLWAPDSAGLSVTGDIDLRARVAATDYTPSSEQTVIAKWETTSNQRSFRAYITTAGALGLEWSANGSTTIAKTSTANLTTTNGAQVWLRWVLDVDNGAAGNDVKFYTSIDGVTWTQLGATVTTASTTAIYNSTARCTVGAERDDGATKPWAGNIYEAQVRNGIGGSLVGNPIMTASVVGATTIVDSTPITWTLAGNAAFSGADTDIAAEYTTRWFDANSAYQWKRWRRPEFLVDDDFSADLLVEVYKDYDPSSAVRTFNISVDPVQLGGVWGVSTWGNAHWAPFNDGQQVFERGTGIGRARAVQLKFIGKSPSMRFGVNAIHFKFLRRRVR